MITFTKRAQAALVGVAVGDSMTAQYEHKKADVVAAMLTTTGGRIVAQDYVNPWDKNGKDIVAKGQPTDDSELTARLAFSLAEKGQFDPSSVYNQLRAFIIERQPMLSERAFGTGSTLRAALKPESYIESLQTFGRGEVELRPSNGALMRNAPVALRYQGDYQALTNYARWQSCITHMHPLSQLACIAHALTLSFVLGGSNPGDAWQKTKGLLDGPEFAKAEEIQTVLAIEPTEPSQELLWPGGKDHTGHVGLSLRIALWAASAPTFEEGILRCARIGGDTDTYAAIAGSILGAHFGIEGIPQEWLDAVKGKDVMIDLAERLLSGPRNL